MKKENINKYYTDEDLINFKKLNKFESFKTSSLENNKTNKHPVKYSMSDNNYFNKFMNDENIEATSSKEIHKLKENIYYNSSDFQKFNKLNQFTNFNNNDDKKNNNEYSETVTTYTSDDMNKFDKIIKTNNENSTNLKSNNKKIKIIDFEKLNEREKKFKNKIGIEKIKIIYFD